MPPTPDERLRILAAYREMPGLRLTIEQASRLCGVERGPCALTLQALVADGVLRAQGQYFLARGDA